VIAEPPPPVHDPEEVRRLADEILSRSEFDVPEPSLLQRAIDWLLRQLERLFGGDGGSGGLESGGGGAGGSSLFTVLVLIVGLVLVVLVVRALRGTWVRRRRVEVEDLDVDVEGRRSAAAWDDLARRLEAEGRWKDGMRARFGSLVERLVDRGVVDDIPGRTTGEYRAEVRDALPEAGDAFSKAADLFDRAWYGDLPTGPAEAERFTADAERVLAAAGAGGRREAVGV
jgi:hypothetical protein